MREQVHQWVQAHRDELIADIGRLVRIPSVAVDGDESAPYGKPCLEALNAFLTMSESYGFETAAWNKQIGRVTLREAGEELALWGHLDVVPVGEGWDYPPFGATVREGVLIGRGAQDNKGQTVACLYVMRCFRELGVPLRRTLRLYVGTDEERGMRDLKNYLLCHQPPAFSIVADSNFPVCFGEKGIVTVRFVAAWPKDAVIRSVRAGSAPNVVPDHAEARLRLAKGEEHTVAASGRAGHTAFPQNSVNAIAALTKALGEKPVTAEEKRLLRFCDLVNQDCYGTALGLCYEDEISGRMTMVGSMLNVGDGRMTLTCNLRCPVTQDMEKLLEQLQAVATANALTLEAEQVSPPHSFPREHAIVRALTQVYEEHTGK